MQEGELQTFENVCYLVEIVLLHSSGTPVKHFASCGWKHHDPNFWLERLRLKKKNFRERHQAAALLITYLPVWFRMFPWIDMLNRHPRHSKCLLLLQLCFLLVTSQFADEFGNSGKKKKILKFEIYFIFSYFFKE